MLYWFEAIAPIRQKFRVLIIAQAAIFITGAGAVFLSTGNVIAAASAALASLVGIMALAIAGERICRPYVNTVLRMEALAAGDTNSPIDYTDYQDCVGRMTKALESFRANIELIQDNRVTNDRIITALTDGINALQSNQFDHQIDVEFGEDHDQLRQDFNSALRSLSALVNSIRETADNVHCGAMEIRAASDDLSQRNEKQANVIEETSSSMNDVTSGIRENARSAAEVQRTIAGMLKEVTEGGEVVRKATDAMGNIEKSSNEITQIISVIDGIAFQTNLLALNAGVEAARAGDAGKGFAVVANEVRALAQRSADAARDIKDLITSSSAQVAGGVALVNETGTLLETILEQVGEANSKISVMAQSASEQSSTLDQVNTAVNGMDGMTRQNAAMVEETTAAIHHMAEEVDQLNKMLGKIKTQGGSVNRASAHAPSASVAPAPSQASAPTASSASTPASTPAPAAAAAPRMTPTSAAPKTVTTPASVIRPDFPTPPQRPAAEVKAPPPTSGNLALKASDFDDDDWSEF